MNIEKKYINYKNNPWGYQISYSYDDICLHNTASDASADNEWEYMNRMQVDGHPTVHYFVDDIKAIKCMPHNVDAWAVSDGWGKGGNTTDIHIEICYSKSGGTKYKKAFDNAMELIATICRDENKSPEGHIKFHYDYGTKYCPHRSLDEFGGSASKLRVYVVNEVNNKLNGGDYPMRKLEDKYTRAEIWEDENVGHGGKNKIKAKQDLMIRRYYPDTKKMKDTGRYVKKGHYETTDFILKEKGSDGIVRNYHALINVSRTNNQIDVICIDHYKA